MLYTVLPGVSKLQDDVDCITCSLSLGFSYASFCFSYRNVDAEVFLGGIWESMRVVLVAIRCLEVVLPMACFEYLCGCYGEIACELNLNLQGKYVLMAGNSNEFSFQNLSEL